MTPETLISLVRTCIWAGVTLAIGLAIAKAIARWGGPPRRGPRGS